MFKFIIGKLTLAAVVLSTGLLGNSCTCTDKPDSNFNGVQIGVISYSWRSMPKGEAEDILSYCLKSGISSIELMGDVAERYAGLPLSPSRPASGVEMTEEERATHDQKVQDAREKQREWRLSVSMDKFIELRNMYNDSGVNIHIVKFAPAAWSDEEIDYAFTAAKAMGAGGITNEIGHEECKRLGKFAEKHSMYAIYHNHAQPGDPGFNFEEFLEYSPSNMLNLDVGHYFGATGKHPSKIIEKLHDRIFSIHLKDKTGRDSEPANTNMPWGEGETPMADILNLIKDNNWPIYCDIELEYPVPDDSDAVKETTLCVDYCREILVK
ncbi:MAG: TIM barrel protein [Bacteroidales bacterium]